MRRSLLPAALTLALALPAPAGAATLFASQGGGGATCSEPAPCSLAGAISVADAASDRDAIVVLGPLSTGATVNLTASPIDLVGSGRGAGGTSIATAAPPAMRIGNASSARNLQVTASGGGPAVVIGIGGDLTSATVTDTTVGANGISIDPLGGPGGTTLSDLAVSGAAGGSAPGLAGNSPAGSRVVLVDSTIAGAAGVSWPGAGTLVIQRSSLLVGGTGVSQTAGELRASSTVVRAATGIDVTGASADLRQMTVAASPGDAAPTGVRSGAGSTVSVTGSIVRDFASDLTATAGGALTAGASNFHAVTGPVSTGLGGDVDLDPRFRDPLGLDFRLRAGSPMIDAAGIGSPAADESPLDRAGHQRALDGDGDAVAQRDMGANEYRRPNAVLSFVTPGQTGAPITFSASASSYPDGEVGSYRWDLDGDGLFETDTGPFPQAVKAFDRPARIDVRLRVVGFDAATDDAVHALTVFDRTRPRVLSASVIPSVFAVDRGATAVSSARRGTVFRYSLSEVATVKIALEQRLVGRRVGRSCLAPTRSRRKHPRCVRFVRRGTLTRRDRPEGVSQTPFTGRVGRRPLPLGRFRATFRATDAGRNTSAPRSAYFRVVLR